ncbi:MAG: RcpC/CpaB family pilus assembly protein [Actinomycetia bacterium]|nr:RcpC/CpaB family pilus assembly protein [Actinomycetes bacterium]
MNRKTVGVIIAVALAAIGTFILVRYVQGADERALEGEETVSVLVVDSLVPEGTAAEDVSGSVSVELVPVKVQAAGSLETTDDLADFEGLVTAVDLVPGEQVIAARFVTPRTLEERDDIVVPDGLLEVTLSLSPERAIGGVLRPGDEVAVFASFVPFTVEAVEPGIEQPGDLGTETDAGSDDGTGSEAGADTEVTNTKTPNTTGIILHNVLVTNVQVEELPQESSSDDADEDSASLELSPTGRLLVTLAMDPANAERFVFTAEFGTVWLADESDTVDDSPTPVQDRGTVYDDPSLGGTG